MINAAARNWSQGKAAALTPLSDAGMSYNHSYHWHPPGHLVIMTATYRLFGFSVGVTRSVSLVSTALAGSLFFLLLRQLQLRRMLAVCGVGLWVLHPLCTWLARSGRMDGFALAFGFAAALILVTTESARIRNWIMAGTLIGIGSLFHVIILAWVPVLWVASAVKARRGLWRAGFALTACAITPVALWVAGVFLSGDGSAWMEQFWGYQIMQRKASGSILMRLSSEAILWMKHLTYVPLVMIVTLAGGAWCVMRARRSEDRWMLAGTGVAFLLIGLGTAKGTGVYPLYWFAWLAMVAVRGLEFASPRIRNALLAAGLVNCVLWFGFQSAVAWYQRDARSPERVEAFFHRHIPTGAIVMGPEDIWYAVEKAGGELRIWASPDAPRHDFWITYANAEQQIPEGFELAAELPDVMPRVFGRYFSHTSYAYRIWQRSNTTAPDVIASTDLEGFKDP